ncbi:xylan 1,4-beta-xylosidase [Streptomyces sp. 549]|uniref:xylan 1,4-beta-xylosidase n=1 Tax=Streptomyces sp. 549 TaxID=3049076 RepID=UPI0024C2DDA9|nr:xylan 1,4-beta-xylosidase [Streptomyces sp. 549]MDK1475686.1 xylan 1,4-beta-xylosidase [Streptomyces sp. 549]
MGSHGQQRRAPRADRWRRAGLFGAAGAALALLVSLCALPPGEEPDNRPPVEVFGTPPAPDGPPGARLGLGLTHTRYSADAGEQAARQRAEDSLTELALPQNQHIMGWGADNPEPAPGRYDFRSLDSRVALMRRTGATPVITLCCAPDWMKGGRAGHTDWDELETAPRPEHYRDFADLAGRIAQRYPDVRHFLVWNEFKGFFDEERRRWDHEGYTELYNLVHDEVKRVREDALVGGPYVVMDSHPADRPEHASALKGEWGSVDQRALDAVTYWNEHRHGADFVVVDGSSYTKDGQLLPDEFAATEKFTAVGRWVRRETGLPLWWAEWYVETADADDRREGWTEQHRTAVQAAALIAMARGGADTALYWNPQSRTGRCAGCLWRGTEEEAGGGALPMLDLLGRFRDAFPPGTLFERPDTGGDPGARVLADDRTALVVNTRDRAITVRVDGSPVKLDPHQVRWLDR